MNEMNAHSRNKLWLKLVVMVLIGLGSFLAIFAYSIRYPRQWEQVQLGMDANTVEKIMNSEQKTEYKGREGATDVYLVGRPIGSWEFRITFDRGKVWHVHCGYSIPNCPVLKRARNRS